MVIENYSQAKKFLESSIPHSRSQKYPGLLGLKRMACFLKLLGLPQDKFASIHVGGTSGKGSTCYLIASILKGAGYKTGLHLSPHLQVMPERMQINNQLISQDKFVKLLNEIIPVINRVAKRSKLGQPTYFEILLAISFLYFAQEKVELAVVEVGMGGRFDGTNVLKPAVVVLDKIGLDHTHILGKTVEVITEDKKEIIKPKTPLITADNSDSVIKIIKKKCRQVQAPFFQLGKDLKYKIKKIDQVGSIFDLRTGENYYQNLKLSLLGQHQVENAALAIGAIEELRKQKVKIKEGAIRKALAQARFAGRLEILQKGPLIILDSAHNPQKMRTLITAFSKLFSYRHLCVIFALKKDKDLTNVLFPLAKIADYFIITKFFAASDVGRHLAKDPEEIAKVLLKIKPKAKFEIQENSQLALKKALKLIKKSDALLTTGSLYLVGEIRSLFFPKALVLEQRTLFPKLD